MTWTLWPRGAVVVVNDLHDNGPPYDRPPYNCRICAEIYAAGPWACGWRKMWCLWQQGKGKCRG